jgi:hypothetical protein
LRAAEVDILIRFFQNAIQQSEESIYVVFGLLSRANVPFAFVGAPTELSYFAIKVKDVLA